MNRDEALQAARRHLWDQAKAQQEIVKELKELNANVKSLVQVMARPEPPPRRKKPYKRRSASG